MFVRVSQKQGGLASVKRQASTIRGYCQTSGLRKCDNHG